MARSGNTTTTTGGSTSAFGWMSIGVTVLSIVFAFMSKRRNNKTKTKEIAVEVTPPHTDSHPLPRTYGTCKVMGSVVWWGNMVIKDSTAKEIEKRYY